MRSKKFLLILLFACAFLYLLCRPQAAPASVRSGLLLWYRSVVPTLLPFMLLTGLLLRLRLLEPLLPFLQRCLAPIFAKLRVLPLVSGDVGKQKGRTRIIDKADEMAGFFM